MKWNLLALGLVMSFSALADSVELSGNGRKARLTSTSNSTTSEIVDLIAGAHEKGHRYGNGAEVFHRVDITRGMLQVTTFTSKNLNAAINSGFAVIYTVDFKGKKGDFMVSDKLFVVTGKSAEALASAMRQTVSPRGPLPVGSSVVTSKSGKVSCSKVVRPDAPTTCTIKF